MVIGELSRFASLLPKPPAWDWFIKRSGPIIDHFHLSCSPEKPASFRVATTKAKILE